MQKDGATPESVSLTLCHFSLEVIRGERRAEKHQGEEGTKGPWEVQTWLKKNTEAQVFRPVGLTVSPSSTDGK